MEPGAAQRYLRQIALPEIGPTDSSESAMPTVAIAAERMDEWTAT